MSQSDPSDQKTRRYLSIAASIAIHSILFFLVARFTIDLTSPEGTVSDAVELEMMPQGSQTSTLNVSAVPAPAVQPTPAQEPPPATSSAVATVLPQKVADTSAVAPVPQQVEETPTEVTPPTESVTPSEVETVAVSDVELDAETSPTTTLEPAVLAAATPVGGDSQNTQEAPPAPVPIESPASAGQGAVSDQSYGVPSGATDAKTLAAMPGNRRPEYPLMARFRRIQGVTVAQFTVSADGTVTNPRIYSSEHDSFKQPVLDAVKSWKFKGPIAAGEYFWTFDFRLAGQEKEAPGRLRRTN